jgi:hypothetical protein
LPNAKCDNKIPKEESVMIEMTEEQARALETRGATPPRLVNPRTKETFVLLRVDEYERLKEEEYDYSPWTREELHALAWEAGKRAASGPRRFGTLKGSVVSIAPGFDDVPEGFEDCLP